MSVKRARDVARRWVLTEGRRAPGFHGAYFAGSTNWLPDDAPFSATSDVDVTIVLDSASLSIKLGKFRYRRVLLEVSNLSREQLRTPEMVLGDYHLAGSFRTSSVILDPSGELTNVQTVVGRDFANRRWVQK